MSEITTNSEMFSNLLRTPFSLKDQTLNLFGNKSVFQVRILTKPEAYSGPASVREDPSPVTNDNVASKYLFKGRILDRNMAHQKFLQDPCDESVADDPAAVARLVQLHSTIILTDTGDFDDLQIGDIIYAEASPGDNNNLYDLQNLTFVGVHTKFGAASNKAAVESCPNLASLLDGWSASDMPSTVGTYDVNPPEDAPFPAGAGAIDLESFEEGICDSADEFFLAHPMGRDQQTNSPFGPRRIQGRANYHRGVDFGAPTGTPIYAAAAGTVSVELGYNKCKPNSPNSSTTRNCGGQYGNAIYIQHDGGYETRYGHLDSYIVQAGQTVSTSQIIGYCGNTGYSLGSHLHFELLQNGRHINPAPFFKTAKCETNGNS